MICQGAVRATLPILLLVASLPPTPLEAGTTAEVTDLLPRASSRDQAQETLSRLAGVRVNLVEPDTSLLTAIRWAAPAPARAECQRLYSEAILDLTSQHRVPVPESQTSVMPALLEQATTQVRLLDLKPALDTLKEARAWIPCLPTRLTSEQVRSLFLTEALAHLYAWDGEQDAAFQRVMVVDPDFVPERAVPSKVREAIKSASRRVERVEALTVETDEPGGALYVDGRALASRVHFPPGEHVVQVESSTHEIRSALVSFEGQSPLRLRASSSLGLLTSLEAREALIEELKGQHVKPELTAALDLWLKEGRRDWQAFAVAAEDGPRVRIYRRGGGVIDGHDLMSAESPAESENISRSTIHQESGAIIPTVDRAIVTGAIIPTVDRAIVTKSAPATLPAGLAASEARLESATKDETLRPK